MTLLRMEYLKRPVNILIIILSLVIAGDLIFFSKVIGRQDSEITSLEEKINSLRGTSRRGGGLERARSGVDAFKKGLPDEKRLTPVLEEVFLTAKKNGLKIPAGDYSPETLKDADISRYMISFPVEGRYSQIKKFIYDLENMKHQLAIEEISMASSKETDGTIGLKIKISAYYL